MESDMVDNILDLNLKYLYLSIQRYKYTSILYMSYSIHRNVYSKYSKFKAHDQIASIYHKFVIITADLSPIFWKCHIHPLSNPMTKHILALEPHGPAIRCAQHVARMRICMKEALVTGFSKIRWMLLFIHVVHP